MFGRRGLLPVDFNSCTEYDPERVLKHFQDATDPDPEEVKTTRKNIEDQVKANIEQAQIKQKEYYDKKHTLLGTFTNGSLVLKKDFTRKRRRGGALDYRLSWTIFHYS